MPNFIIRIIRPVERTPEFEYIKEFFRFIGVMVTDCAIDDAIKSNWLNALVPEVRSKCIDIVMNAQEDPYEDRCKQLGIKRIYCNADFDKNVLCGRVVDQPTPLEKDTTPELTKKLVRQRLLRELVDKIWDDSDAKDEIKKIAEIYLGNFDGSQGELFYFLQAKRNLRVLLMGEVLREPTANVTNIPLFLYINQCIAALWAVCSELKELPGLHGRYAWVNASNKIYEITAKLYDTERPKVSQITYTKDMQAMSCRPPERSVLIQTLERLLQEEPEFLSAHLLMANICGAYAANTQAEKLCYQRLWNSISRNSPDYAFMWYRNAYFQEKREKNLGKALEYYRYAVKLDPNCYQAMFKLGYYAAAENRFEQAEYLLKQMIQSIFRGRSTDPDENGAYSNWLALSSKQSQYIYKAYVLLAKIALNRRHENSVRTYIGRACMAATRFEEATAIRQISDNNDPQYNNFMGYHQFSTPVWAMWQVMSPWTENIIHDLFVRDIVRNRLERWEN